MSAPYCVTPVGQVVMTRPMQSLCFTPERYHELLRRDRVPTDDVCHTWQASLSQGWQWYVSSPTREGAIAGALLAPTGTGLEDVMMGARE